MSKSVVSLVCTRRDLKGSFYYEGDYNEIVDFLHAIEGRLKDDLRLSIVSERGIFSEYRPYTKCLSLYAFESNILSC